MMRWIVETALRLRFVVVALAFVLMVAGTRAARNTPLDVFPEFAPPLVEMQTEAPGLSTSEVEALVTVPIETAMNGVVGLKTLRSKIVLGLSSVVLIFEDGTDLLSARQLVQERLLRIATSLPVAAHAPVILSPLSSLSRVMKIGMTSDKLSQVEMTTLAKWTMRPRLMSIPGVANVAIWGQRDRQLQVLIDPARLRASNVTLADLTAAAREGTSTTAGGFLETAQQRLAVAHAPAVSQRRRSPPDPDRPAAGRGRRGPSPVLDQCRQDRRRRRRDGRIPAADRRRDHQRRPRPAADRREAPGRQHAGGHAGRGSGARGAQARPARRRGRFDDLPSGDLHRAVAAPPEPGARWSAASSSSSCWRCFSTTGARRSSAASRSRCRSSPPRCCCATKAARSTRWSSPA